MRAVLRSVLSMIEQGATHIGVATDHVVESFRNDLYAGHKTSVPPTLLSQFPVLEEALDAMGVVVWPMVEYEAAVEAKFGCEATIDSRLSGRARR